MRTFEELCHFFYSLKQNQKIAIIEWPERRPGVIRFYMHRQNHRVAKKLTSKKFQYHHKPAACVWEVKFCSHKAFKKQRDQIVLLRMGDA